MRGTSNGKTVADTFTVTVNPADDRPVVANPIADPSTVNEDSAPSIIDLSSVFTDIDSDDATITEAATTTNPGLVNPVIEGNQLTLNYVADAFDNQITVEGTINGLTSEPDDIFTVNVAPVDDGPAVANAIADVAVNEDAAVPPSTCPACSATLTATTRG